MMFFFKKNKALIIFLIFFLVIVQNGYAISISPSIVEIAFEPNHKESFVLDTWGSENIELYKKGDLAEYVTFDQTSFKGRGKALVTINFPEKLDRPGEHKLIIGAREVAEGRGMISAVAAIQIPVYIMVPYEGTYIEAFLSAPDANIDELIFFDITVNNLGTENIAKISTFITIYTYPSNDTIAKFRSEIKQLPTKSTINFRIPFNTTGKKSGDYKAVADIYYDQYETSIEEHFKIGELLVDILSYPKSIYNGTINKFPIEVESKWNNNINDVYAEINIKTTDGNDVIEELKTPTIDLKPWGKDVIDAYIDTAGVNAGEYNLTITLHYDGKTTVKEDIIIINEKKEFFSPSRLNIILIAVVIALVVFDVTWVIRKRRKNVQK